MCEMTTDVWEQLVERQSLLMERCTACRGPILPGHRYLSRGATSLALRVEWFHRECAPA